MEVGWAWGWGFIIGDIIHRIYQNYLLNIMEELDKAIRTWEKFLKEGTSLSSGMRELIVATLKYLKELKSGVAE